MNTPDPTEYLRARYAEDEGMALACAETYPPPWELSDRGHAVTLRADGPNFWPVTVLEQSPSIDGWLGDYVEHIARHDPARVLAGIAAKRAVLDKCDSQLPPPGCPADPYSLSTTLALAVVRALLLEFADREDFPDEWRTT